MIRTAAVMLVLVVLTIPFGLIVIIAGLLRVAPGLLDSVPRLWTRSILRVSGTPVHVEGLEHIRPDEPQIIASNHQSWYDVFALADVIPKRYRFVAKRELERIPIFGGAWKAAGHISIDRSDRRSAIRSLDQAGELIREDNSAIIIFPEGTRSPDGRLLPFKKGGFMLAVQTGVDIVPTAVIGTREIKPKGAWRIRPRPIIVRFGEPIRTTGYSEETRDELIGLVRSRIEELLQDRPSDPARRAS